MKRPLLVVMAIMWHPSLAVSDALTKQLDALIAQINDLADDFVGSKLLPLDTTAADKAEKQMNMIVLPFYNSFAGIRTTNKKVPLELTSADVTNYQAFFLEYAKVYTPSDELYEYYTFGKYFLSLLSAVNAFQTDLAAAHINAAADITLAKLSQALLADATAYQDAFAAYNNFVKSVSTGFKKPFSVLLSDVYQEETACADKIISLEAQVPAPADEFILQNFDDNHLATLTITDVQPLLDSFAKTYTVSDPFYAEYQMWSSYVSTRYWQLQLLNRIQINSDGSQAAAVKVAANAFAGTYLNGFKVTHAKNAAALKEPYVTQLNDLDKEFVVTYWLAELEIRNN